MTAQAPSSSATVRHLQRQLVLSLRVASDKIVEVETQNRAYESLLSAYDQRVVELKRQLRHRNYWPWITLVTTTMCYILHHFT